MKYGFIGDSNGGYHSLVTLPDPADTLANFAHGGAAFVPGLTQPPYDGVSQVAAALAAGCDRLVVELVLNDVLQGLCWPRSTTEDTSQIDIVTPAHAALDQAITAGVDFRLVLPPGVTSAVTNTAQLNLVLGACSAQLRLEFPGQTIEPPVLDFATDYSDGKVHWSTSGKQKVADVVTTALGGW